MRRHRTRCRDATIFQTDVSSSPAKSRRSSVLRTTDGDGRGPRVRPGTWRATLMAPSAEVHFGLRRSPLLWWGRRRLRKAQMLQNGSGRFEVGNHGQDLAFPSASGAPEQLKPEGSFQQLRPRNSPALPPRPRSRASFGLSRTSTVVAAAAGVAGCCSTRGHRHHLPTPPGVGRKDPMIANVMGARRGNQASQTWRWRRPWPTTRSASAPTAGCTSPAPASATSSSPTPT